QELRDKLYEWGLHKRDVERMITQMVEEGFMNEERFALAYAGGKFRIKNWGRIKIKLALKQKKVSDYCIRKALNQFDEKDYQKTLEKIIASYSKKISEKNVLKKNYKVAQHAIGKGFEPELVWEILRIEN
ncbi:MAG TPA: regulatory protein RecX, partial [Bacteroidia bacterium]|nr:regulatory protein RecX [Bacteroidia bacterium]